ncbi:MAG: hypothetical protein E6K54_07270 [Gammaproteobacteria bacterium]|nr:MAG: hypothetical protein E6K54_07270 [Gammaproteobacteria bacterium]
MYFNATTDHRSGSSKLPKNFWLTLQQFKLTMKDKLILIYLYTSPYTNRLGYVQCHPVDIAEELNKKIEDIYSSLKSLQKHNFIKIEKIQDFIYLPHYLEQFPIKDKNQGKHIECLFNKLIENFIENNFSSLMDLIFKLLKSDHLSRSFRKSLKELFYDLHKFMLGGE